MPIEIKMPALSPTMTEGGLSKWLKQEGEAVKAGDAIAEIETDKATMEVEAADDGTLARIVVAEGSEGIKVGAVIALLLEEGEDPAAAESAPAAPPPIEPKPAETKPTEMKPAAPRPAASASTPPAAKPPRASGQPAPAPSAAPAGGEGGRLFASPLARRLAGEGGIDLRALHGSGPHGRIVKSDVDAALAGGGPVAAAAAVQGPAPAGAAAPASPAAVAEPGRDQVAAAAGNPPYELIPHDAMRRTIARRMTQSQQTIPSFTLTIDCVIDELLDIRQRLNARAGDRFKLSVNDFVVRAVALALQQVPAVNAAWSEDGMLQWQQSDIGVAVAIENGLITPIIRRAETKGLAEIANEVKDLSARARAGKLKLDEFQGGSFAISNLGMFGIKHFTAVINPPHAAILAVGMGEQRAIVRDGALGIATVMSCTLTADHRVFDGATGAVFMQAYKKLIEDPLAMLL